MEQVTITVRIPREIYDKVSEAFTSQGVTLEEAVLLFIRETVQLGRIPFNYTEEDIAEVRRWEKMMNDDLRDV